MPEVEQVLAANLEFMKAIRRKGAEPSANEKSLLLYLGRSATPGTILLIALALNSGQCFNFV